MNLDITEMSTMFFVMMGPLRVVGPFAAASCSLPRYGKIALALRVAAMSTFALLFAAYVGGATLARWKISSAALLFAAGLTLFFVSMGMVLKLPAFAPNPQPSASPGEAAASAVQRVMPAIVTPFGVGTLLTFVSLAPHSTGSVVGAFAGVMILNFITMAFADVVLRWFGGVLVFAGQILAVLQVALSIEMVLGALSLLRR